MNFKIVKKTTLQITVLQEFYGKIIACGAYVIAEMASCEQAAETGPAQTRVA